MPLPVSLRAKPVTRPNMDWLKSWAEMQQKLGVSPIDASKIVGLPEADISPVSASATAPYTPALARKAWEQVQAETPFPDLPEEGEELVEGVRLMRGGEVVQEGVGFPIGHIDPKTGKFQMSWQAYGQGALGKVGEAVETVFAPFTATGIGLREVTTKGGGIKATSLGVELELLNQELITGTITKEDYQKEHERVIQEMAGKVEEYKKQPWWQQLLWESPAWAVLAATGLSGLRAWRAAGQLPTPVKIAARVPLAPIAGGELALGTTLKYGIGIPLKYATKGVTQAALKTFEKVLDTGLDKWIAQQGRIDPRYRSWFADLIVKDRDWLVEKATENLKRRLAEKKGVSYANTQAVNDTIVDIEARLLPTAEAKPLAIPKPGEPFQATGWRGVSPQRIPSTTERAFGEGTYYAVDLPGAKGLAETIAKRYAAAQPASELVGAELETAMAEVEGGVIQAEINLTNPMVVDEGSKWFQTIFNKGKRAGVKQGLAAPEANQMGFDEIQKEVKRLGHDGLIVVREEGYLEVVLPQEAPVAKPLVEEVTPAVSQDIANIHNELEEGSTYNISDKIGDMSGKPYYSVSLYPERTEVLTGQTRVTEADIEAFIAKNADLLNKPGNSVGSWTRDGKDVVLDVVVTPASREEAIRLGLQNNQEAIFDLEKGEEIPLAGFQDLQITHYGRVVRDIVATEDMGKGEAGSEAVFYKEYKPWFKEGWFVKRSYWYASGQTVEPRFKGMPSAETTQLLKVFDTSLVTEAERTAFLAKKEELLSKFRAEFGQQFGNLAQQGREVDFATAKALGYEGVKTGQAVTIFKDIDVKAPAVEPKVIPQVPGEPEAGIQPTVKNLQTMYRGLEEIVNAQRIVWKGKRGIEAELARKTINDITKELGFVQELIEKAAEIDRRPSMSSMRQHIMAVVKAKGLPKSQTVELFKRVTGKAGLTRMTQTQLEDVLDAVFKARPKTSHGKRVVTLKTENSIQSLKNELISKGKLTEEGYSKLLGDMGLATDRYITRNAFATEAEGRAIIRNVLLEERLGFAERDITISKNLEKAPADMKEIYESFTKRVPESDTSIARTVGDFGRQLAGIGQSEASKVDVSSLWSIQNYAEKLSIRSGDRRFYDLVTEGLTAREFADAKHTERMLSLENSTKEFSDIANNNAALQRVNDYISAQNELGAKYPAGITDEEVKLAQAIQDNLKSWEGVVRIEKFLNAYKLYNGDAVKMVREEIKDATTADIRKAITAYESKGIDGLREFTDTQSWGIIGSGYEPHEVIKPRVSARKPVRSKPGTVHLRVRTGIDYQQERNILQRVDSYDRAMLRRELTPYIEGLDRALSENINKLANPGKIAHSLSLFSESLLGAPPPRDLIIKVLTEISGMAYKAIFRYPALSLRNLFQPLAFVTDKTQLFTVLTKPLNKELKLYYDAVISQMVGVERDLLLYEEFRPGRVGKFLRKTEYYPMSDEIGRLMTFNAAYNKASSALEKFKETGNIQDFINSSGMLEFSPIRQRAIMEHFMESTHKYGLESLKDVSGQEQAVRDVATFATNDTHFMYRRQQRSPAEMGEAARPLTSLLVFPKQYVERVYQHLNRIAPGSKASTREKARSWKALIAVIVGGTIVGEAYKKLSGKETNSYSPVNITRWSGGLAIGVSADVTNAIYLITEAAMGNKAAEGQLASVIPALGDTFIPFYSPLMNLLEAAVNEKYIDRKVLRKIRSEFDETYIVDDSYYSEYREPLEAIRHAIFGTETPDPVDEAIQPFYDEYKILTSAERRVKQYIEAGKYTEADTYIKLHPEQNIRYDASRKVWYSAPRREMDKLRSKFTDLNKAMEETYTLDFSKAEQTARKNTINQLKLKLFEDWLNARSTQ